MNVLPTRRTPSPPPMPSHSLSRKSSTTSNGSFVCNVSDDQVIERDVDLEIEARIRAGSDSETDGPPPPRISRKSSLRSIPQRTSGSPVPSTKSTLSQRMLSALQRKKNQTTSRTKRSGSILLEVVQADQTTIPEMSRTGSNHSMEADIDGLVVPDPLYDPTQDPVYMSDDENGPISHSMSTSCKDRLEARISDRLLQNKSSLSVHPEGQVSPEPSELSIVYTNRRTYPAESSKKTDPRYSEANQLETRYERAGVTPERRVNRAVGKYYEQFGSQQYSKQFTQKEPVREEPQQPFSQSSHVNLRGSMEPTMEILDANKSLPVAFQFQGQHSSSPTKTPPQERPQSQHHGRSRDEAHTTLLESLVQIEQVVGGLENCLMASSFSSLAMVALRELELLRETTQQIRTSATTRILAEIAHSHSQMLGLYRQLVARAAALQSRIEGLIHHIRSTC